MRKKSRTYVTMDVIAIVDSNDSGHFLPLFSRSLDSLSILVLQYYPFSEGNYLLYQMEVITVRAQRAALASAAVPAVVTVVTVVETANQRGSLFSIGMHLKWALMQWKQLATTGYAVVDTEV